jgi:hypothetical protein
MGLASITPEVTEALPLGLNIRHRTTVAMSILKRLDSAQILFLDFEGQDQAFFVSQRLYAHIRQTRGPGEPLREHAQALLGKKTLRPFADGASC